MGILLGQKAYFSSPGYRGHLETLMCRRPDQLHMIYFVRDGVRIGASQYCTYKTEDGKCERNPGGVSFTSNHRLF